MRINLSEYVVTTRIQSLTCENCWRTESSDDDISSAWFAQDMYDTGWRVIDGKVVCVECRGGRSEEEGEDD